MESLSVRTKARTEFVDITDRVVSIVRNCNVEEGLCCVYAPHTTAGVTITENADPSVVQDMIKELNKIVPFDDGYSHTEGNSAAHIKASLVGSSVIVPISGGRLVLGTWQGIYFCEFDGPRSRRAYVVIK
jgi:secondary thiamine-phosphate synthase enzyme